MQRTARQINSPLAFVFTVRTGTAATGRCFRPDPDTRSTSTNNTILRPHADLPRIRPDRTAAAAVPRKEGRRGASAVRRPPPPDYFCGLIKKNETASLFPRPRRPVDVPTRRPHRTAGHAARRETRPHAAAGAWPVRARARWETACSAGARRRVGSGRVVESDRGGRTRTAIPLARSRPQQHRCCLSLWPGARNYCHRIARTHALARPHHHRPVALQRRLTRKHTTDHVRTSGPVSQWTESHRAHVWKANKRLFGRRSDFVRMVR